MVYIKDFEYLKPKISKVSHLQTFEKKKRLSLLSQTTKQSDQTLGKILRPYVVEYLETSSVHGLRYLTHPKFKYYEKFIWGVLLISTTVACSYVYYELAQLYQTQRLQTTIADSIYPVFMIPFPAIGICPRYRIDWQRLRNEAPTKFLPRNASEETLEAFFRFFEKLADTQFSSLNYLSSLFYGRHKVNLTLIDNVDVLEVLEYLTVSCSEAFSEFCKWRTKAYNCCELFTVERTEAGICYIFNSNISPSAKEKLKRNSYQPYHNSLAGEGTGLQARLRIDENKIDQNYTQIQGLHVMIKKSQQWHADVKFVNYNTFTKLALTAQITETGPGVRVVSPDDRRCIFDDETKHHLYKKIPGLEYWRGNCRIRCHQEYVLKFCKCNLHVFHPVWQKDNFTNCKPSNFKCIYEHAKIFQREQHIFESKYIHDVGNDSMTCNCLNNCNHLFLDGFFSSVPLEGVKADGSNKLIHLDIHYHSATILKYRTSIRYTFVELMANFGGIIGLFLGGSLLSAIELIYYFTIGLYARLHGQLHDWYGKRTPNSQRTRVIKRRPTKISRTSNDEYFIY